MAAGVWNASVRLRALKERGYTGGYTSLGQFLQSPCETMPLGRRAPF
ncbi:MAG TPA: hypothetical protein VFB38_19735 [Chthonomonadaceae bacterium]|nr:hypothetical protein [Chthonomonadaceae bacterium]